MSHPKHDFGEIRSRQPDQYFYALDVALKPFYL